jgi:hypothetical protein
MSLIFCLIISIIAGHGAGVTTTEIYGQQACEKARDAAESLPGVKAVCVNKGAGK